MKKKSRVIIRNALLLSSLLLTGCSLKNSKEVDDNKDTNKIIIEQSEYEEELCETENSENAEIHETDESEDIEEIHENEHVDILMIGDMLIHEPVYKSGIQGDESLNYDHFFENIQGDLDEAEIKIVNQETILGGSEIGFSSYPCFNSPQEIGDSEAKAGFNVILHATNHAMDKGFPAVKNTIEFWRKNYPDITMLGLNLNEEEQNNIQIYEQNDFKIALLNYTYGTNGISLPEDKPYLVNLLDAKKVTKDIKKAKSLADFVVVMPHWGY